MKTILLILILLPFMVYCQNKSLDSLLKELKRDGLVTGSTGGPLTTGTATWTDEPGLSKWDTVKAHITVRPFSEYFQNSSNHGWIEYGYRVKTSDGFVYFLDSFKFIIDPNRIIKTEIKDWDRPGRTYYY